MTGRWIAFAALGAALAVTWALPEIRAAIAPRVALSFADVEGAPGFRIADRGGASAVLDPFAGIGGAAAATPGPAALCAALADEGPGVAVGPDAAPRLAVLSDYRCPFCRVLSGTLLDMAADGRVRVVHHEWPILGPASDSAARLALAAAGQGAYEAMHRRLMRTGFVVDEAYAAAAGQEMGLDVGALLAAMRSPETEAALRNGRLIATGLGLVGTPAIVVGGTVVVGQVDRATIEAALRGEADRPDAPCPAE